jgi:hypothetical protein
VTTTETLAITKNDTLRIKMRGSERFDIPFGRSSQYVQLINSNTEDVAVYRNVRLIVRSTRDSLAYVQTVKRTKGSSYDVAKEQAEAMILNYDLSDNELAIDGFFTGEREAQYRHVRPSVEIIVYLPEGATLIADENTYSYHRNDRQYRDILDNGDEEKFLTVGNGKLICSTCPEDRDNDDDNSWQQSDDNDAWEERSYREGEDTPAWETNNQAPDAPNTPKNTDPNIAPTPPQAPSTVGDDN